MVILMQDRIVQLNDRIETDVLCVLKISLEFLHRFF